MADTRSQIYAFIEAQITDPLNKQNTALVVRNVLKYIVQNAANLADDDILALLNPFKPVLLDDAQTVTANGSESTNFLLNAPALIENLSVTNTKAGLDYRISITNNTAAKTVTLVPIAGVVYKGYDEASTEITSVDVPVGDSAILYYHEGSVRRVVVVDGNTGNGEGGGTPVNTTPQALSDGASIVFDATLGVNATLSFTQAHATRTLVLSNLSDGLSLKLALEVTNGEVLVLPAGYTCYRVGAGLLADRKITLPTGGVRCDVLLQRLGSVLEVSLLNYVAAEGSGTGSGGSTVTDHATNGYITVDGVPVQVYDDSQKLSKTDSIKDLWTGTQAAYDALGTKAATTLYFIV